LAENSTNNQKAAVQNQVTVLTNLDATLKKTFISIQTHLEKSRN